MAGIDWQGSLLGLNEAHHNGHFKKTALVIGPTGIVGRAIVEELGGTQDWSVIAASKSGAPVPGAQASISANLLNRKSALERLADAKGATHLFYAAYAPRASVVQ